MTDVDSEACTAPLSAFCFMTGFMYAFFFQIFLHTANALFIATWSHFPLYSSGVVSRQEISRK